MTQSVLIIGGGIKSVQAALDLADSGIAVTLATASSSLGEGAVEDLRLMPKFLSAAHHPNIRLVTAASIASVKVEPDSLKVSVNQLPRYVDIDNCASCGRCERECPVEVKETSGKIRGKAIHRPDARLKAVPSAYAIEKKGVPPCNAACPAGVNAQGYIALVSRGKFAEAHRLITENIPFARVLGRVCTHPCEKQCSRGKVDQPVSICSLKRFAADRSRYSPETSVKSTWAARVAIIGAGAAGLSAAWELARLGHKSTVFESLPVAGGMITVGMPRFRLPREVRQDDIRDIVKRGIEIRTSTLIGQDFTVDDLKRLGYEAILIATGAHENRKLGIPGEYLPGVLNSIMFLRALNLKQPIKVGRRVVVVGGGYTAVDSARTAVRLHCDKVSLLYRRSLEEMPANPEEVAEAREEGVEIQYLVAPIRVVGQDRVTGVECQRMSLGEPDRSGRRTPIPIAGSEFFIEADTVIVAVGQRPDLSFLKGYPTLIEGHRHIVVDPVTMATPVPGIFAAGDVAGEPGPMVNAVAAGRRAAVSIDKYLRGESLKEAHPKKITPVTVDLKEVFIPSIERQHLPTRKYADRLGNFEEVNLGFTKEAAIKEARRCLNCGVCSECLECVRACELDAIDHHPTTPPFELEVNAIIADSKAIAGIEADHRVYSLEPAPDYDLTKASALAGRVLVDIASHDHTSRATPKARQLISSDPYSTTPHKMGVFICGCGGNISQVVNIPAVLAEFKDVAFGREIDYACTAEAAAKIKKLARQNQLTHVVLAACACCNFDQICYSCSDRRIRCKANLLYEPDHIYYEFVNIREHCAWAHAAQAEPATAKAVSLIKASLARAQLGKMTPNRQSSTEQSVLVVGGGRGGIQAAIVLAALGFNTTLMSQAEASRELKELASRKVKILGEATLLNVESTACGYRAVIGQDSKILECAAGAMVLDLSENIELPPLLQKGLPQTKAPPAEPTLTRLPGIFQCGTTKDDDASTQGSAAAAKVSAWLNRPAASSPALACVDKARCRGCGTCVAICQFGAVKLKEMDSGVSIAEIDERLCQGCGVCVAHCPSGALTQIGASDDQLNATMEAILS